MKTAWRLGRLIRALLSCAVPIAALVTGHGSVAAPLLGSYNVDPARISVSGFSAGGYFAMQLGVAYSSIFRGVAIFAGGPYDCARSENPFGCMNNATPDISASIANMKSWSSNRIDSVDNIGRQRIYILTGKDDITVGPNVTRQVKRLYVDIGGFVSNDQVKYVELAAVGHTFPTDFNRAGDSPCGLFLSPYISNCRFDAAGDALRWIYGTLERPNTGTLAGRLLAFDQTPFITPGTGLDATGWVYIPASCAAGQRCSLHVALHGCQQAVGTIGAYFLDNTGFNRWADTNKIILLYPQASASLINLFGCWDWVGLYGSDFDQKSGAQMKAIVAMIHRVASASSTLGPVLNRAPDRAHGSRPAVGPLVPLVLCRRAEWERPLCLRTSLDLPSATWPPAGNPCARPPLRFQAGL